MLRAFLRRAQNCRAELWTCCFRRCCRRVTNPPGMEMCSLPLWRLKKERKKKKTRRARRIRQMLGSVSTSKLFEVVHHVFLLIEACFWGSPVKTTRSSLYVSRLRLSPYFGFWHTWTLLWRAWSFFLPFPIFAINPIACLWTSRPQPQRHWRRRITSLELYISSFPGDDDVEVGLTLMAKNTGSLDMKYLGTRCSPVTFTGMLLASTSCSFATCQMDWCRNGVAMAQW